MISLLILNLMKKKSANTQARACAIYSYLLKNNKVDEYINDIEKFKTLYK